MDFEEYFGSTTPPKHLPQISTSVNEFVDFHLKEGRRIALVTVASFPFV